MPAVKVTHDIMKTKCCLLRLWNLKSPHRDHVTMRQLKHNYSRHRLRLHFNQPFECTRRAQNSPSARFIERWAPTRHHNRAAVKPADAAAPRSLEDHQKILLSAGDTHPQNTGTTAPFPFFPPDAHRRSEWSSNFKWVSDERCWRCHLAALVSKVQVWQLQFR